MYVSLLKYISMPWAVMLCKFGHLVCGESWLAIKIFNPLPQFSRLGILCTGYVVCCNLVCSYCLDG